MAKPNVITLTAERARELLRYKPETGKLYWRVNRSSRARAGTEAGWIDPDRYRIVMIDGRSYKTHRLAWLIVTGVWPEADIDHINGDGLNNRWHNLREVQRSGNLRNAKRYRNNTSGITGVYWHKARRKWRAEIQGNGTHVHLGYFDTLPAAIEARKVAERRYGYHENHGRT